MSKRKRGRSGNLLVVFAFSMVFALLAFMSLSLAGALNMSNKDTVGRYAKMQSYRSISEIAVYQFIRNLLAVAPQEVEVHAFTFTGPSLYTGALETLFNEALDGETEHFDGMSWEVKDVNGALSGAEVTDNTTIVNLLGLTTSGLCEFELGISDFPEIGWHEDGTDLTASKVTLMLEPLEVKVYLRVKGEILHETFYVYGLQLFLENYKAPTPGGPPVKMMRFSIEEPVGGVLIYRA